MTTQIKPQKKMGRPKVHKHVMTTAERQQRWRDKVRADAYQLLLTIKERNENEQH